MGSYILNNKILRKHMDSLIENGNGEHKVLNQVE